MDDIDSLLDSLIQRNNIPKASYVDDKYAGVFKIEDVGSKGQGVFAERALSVDAPICSVGYPTMMAIDSDFLQTTCYHCLVVTANPLPLTGWGHASIELKTCNGCHFARFCNRECQVKSWHAYHKYECRIYKKLRNNLPSPILRAVMRMVLLKDRNMVAEEEWNRVISLTSNEHILAARGRSNLTEMAEGIRHLTESGMSTEMIQRLVFVMKFNTIELPTPLYGGIGVMLDPLVAKFNHSCQPNVAIHRPQHTMISGWMNSTDLSEEERKTFVQIIPLRDIEKGEELLNCYVVPTMSVNARKAKLMEDYFFECNCAKCQSDVQAWKTLSDELPNLPSQFEQWTKSVTRHLSQVNKNSHALRSAASAMDKSQRFLDYPTLYTTGDFPQIAMGLILEGLKAQAFDEALLNVLRIYFLVNPSRLVGRHNPTHIYTIFLMLDIFDRILDESTGSNTSNENLAKCLKNLEARGLSRGSLIYWRDRVCRDLRKRLDRTGAKDLLTLVDKRVQHLQKTVKETADGSGEGPNSEAEQAMRAALGIKDPLWTSVLEQNGC